MAILWRVFLCGSAVLIGLQIFSVSAKEKTKSCPASTLCLKIHDQYKRAKAGDTKARDNFVELLETAFPKYDCKRSYDRNPVPAVWLCEEVPGIVSTDVENWFFSLSRTPTRKARELYASNRFRAVLDGALAELFFDDSLKAEKELKKKRK
jgi:hypothetical protein